MYYRIQKHKKCVADTIYLYVGWVHYTFFVLCVNNYSLSSICHLSRSSENTELFCLQEASCRSVVCFRYLEMISYLFFIKLFFLLVRKHKNNSIKNDFAQVLTCPLDPPTFPFYLLLEVWERISGTSYRGKEAGRHVFRWQIGN